MGALAVFQYAYNSLKVKPGTGFVFLRHIPQLGGPFSSKIGAANVTIFSDIGVNI